MKYDCTKVLDFVHERKRLCDANDDNCGNCELSAMFCQATIYLDQEMIDIVQTWSNENPEKTRQGKFLEQYPRVAKLGGVILIKPCYLDNEWAKAIDCKKISCWDCREKYWNEVVE